MLIVEYETRCTNIHLSLRVFKLSNLPFPRGIQDVHFRAAYGKIGQLRGFVHCPLFCITATAGKATIRQIMKTLHMHVAKLIKILPDKPNCKCMVTKCSGEIEDELNWVLNALKEKKREFPKTLIYCRTLSSCGEFCSFFTQELDATYKGMFAMYHLKTPEDIQREVLESLVDPTDENCFCNQCFWNGCQLTQCQKNYPFWNSKRHGRIRKGNWKRG